jgi:nitroimidazol reductase NimA-like FMN-containing flavoprotein (pyridoxamine 5'-phosphate oxidase superfamily)
MPVISKLQRHECEAILGRNHVGRIAYARRNEIDIEPVHYVYDDAWIYGRTSQGRKMEMIGHAWRPVAFEVDEVDDLFHWRSVVVHGGFYVIDRDGPKWEVEAWERGIELLRRLIPETLREGDPVASRTILFRIAVQDISGREAVPG